MVTLYMVPPNSLMCKCNGSDGSTLLKLHFTLLEIVTRLQRRLKHVSQDC